MPELMKLLKTKSTMRYLPPNGTAGLARSFVRGKSRVPLPPARMSPRTRSLMGRCPSASDGVIIASTKSLATPPSPSLSWAARLRAQPTAREEPDEDPSSLRGQERGVALQGHGSGVHGGDSR